MLVKVNVPMNQTDQTIIYHLVMNPLQPITTKPVVTTNPKIGDVEVVTGSQTEDSAVRHFHRQEKEDQTQSLSWR